MVGNIWCRVVLCLGGCIGGVEIEGCGKIKFVGKFGCKIGENVFEYIGGDNDIELVWILDEKCSCGVY